ncbi:Spermatogenesis-associated protein 6, partial [Clarias magur]
EYTQICVDWTLSILKPSIQSKSAFPGPFTARRVDLRSLQSSTDEVRIFAP